MSRPPRLSQTEVRDPVHPACRLAGGLPAVALALILLWTGDFRAQTQWTLSRWSLAPGARSRWRCASVSRALCRRSRTCWRRCARATSRSVPAAARPDDALGEAMREVNALSADAARAEIGRARGHGAAAQTVMSEIDVAIFTFDSGEQRLRLVNRAGERLLGRPAERLLGRHAGETRSGRMPGRKSGPHAVQGLPRRRGALGRSLEHFPPARVAAPAVWWSRISRARCARRNWRPGSGWCECWATSSTTRWRRSNPSPAVSRPCSAVRPLPPDWRDDTERGLTVIAGRAEALSRFLDAYRAWPSCRRRTGQPVDVGPWVRRVRGA